MAVKEQSAAERIKELETEVDNLEGRLGATNDELAEAEDRVHELERALDDRGHIEELIGIRDDLRAGRHAIALDRITRWLDKHADCWRTLAPAFNQPSLFASND